MLHTLVEAAKFYLNTSYIGASRLQVAPDFIKGALNICNVTFKAGDPSFHATRCAITTITFQ